MSSSLSTVISNIDNTKDLTNRCKDALVGLCDDLREKAPEFENLTKVFTDFGGKMFLVGSLFTDGNYVPNLRKEWNPANGKLRDCINQTAEDFKLVFGSFIALLIEVLSPKPKP